MEHDNYSEPESKVAPKDIPKVHTKCNHIRPHTSPHVSPETTNPSTSGLQTTLAEETDIMRKDEEETNGGKEKEGSVSDWISGGPIGSKGAVLIFRSCVLASRTPSTETTKTVGNNTGNNILFNKAKNMAKRLVSEPHSFSVRPKNIMHDVMETFGTVNKFSGQAYVVRHVSNTDVPEAVPVEEQGHETAEHKRDIDDVLNDLSKITLKKHLDIENTTANIKPAEDPPPNDKENKEDKKVKKVKGKTKRKSPQIKGSLSPQDSEDSENVLVKEVNSIKVLECSNMPANILKITYKLVNTETKLLHRLLQAHGLQEAPADSKDFTLLWAGLHPKPDVLRSLTPYQRVNHFPRSYELTRKDKLFKNIEKMQYFRGMKNFDFIPTTFLMPAEYKDLCTAHYRTKGPWIVKPAASSRGRGIYIVNNPEQIPKGDNVVVAKYIDKPLLIGGHKCDLRLYVCVTSVDPLLIYLYEEGLVRFATVKYDKTNKNLWNPCMHLCNYSINKYHTDYIKCSDPVAGDVGHKWTLSALLRTLRAHGRDTRALMARVEELVVKSVLSSAHTMAAAARAFVPHAFNCFELFGYDILIDDDLKPWLLEINLSPSLACESPLDARVKSALLADTLTLVGLPAIPSTGQESASNNNSLKMRIGACRRVHSAENVSGRGGAVGGVGGGGGGGGGGGALSGEELRVVRAVRAQYARRGGFVRIFPSQNSWQKYAQYLDPVTGIPVCSTSVNSGAPYAALQHNYNLLVHAHVLPRVRHADTQLDTDTPQRLQRYETVLVAGAAPAVQLGAPPAPPPAPRDARHARDLVKHQLAAGLRLTLQRYEAVLVAGAAPAVQLGAPPAPPPAPRDARHARDLVKHQLAAGLRLTLQRYEAVLVAGAAPAVQLGAPPAPPPAPRDARHARDLVKHQLAAGLRLTLQRYEAVLVAGAAPAVQLGAPPAPPPAPRDARHARDLVKHQLAAGLRLTLQRYEAVLVAGAAPAVQLGAPPAPPPAPRDARHARDLVKHQLAAGLRLTPGECRRAFGLYLTQVVKRLSSGGDVCAAHAALVLRFLRRASAALRMPYHVQGPPAKMCDKDRCAVVAKQLNDFLYLYCRDADLCTDAERREGCVSNIHFAQFLYSASEADLEDVLLLVLRMENHVAPFLGDARNPYCVDLPAERLQQLQAAPRHALLRLLAALAPASTRRHRPPPEIMKRPETPAEENHPLPSQVKESLRQEKPLEKALKYAHS